MKQLVLTITDTARKYGYIIWHKKDDPEVGAFFENSEHVKIVVSHKEPKWKKLIGSVGVYESIRISYERDYVISKIEGGVFIVTFK